MKNHVKVYFSFFEYSGFSFMPCEVCGAVAKDIHHIEPRGMGGDPTGEKDNILNLMAVCRTCHDLYGDKKQHKDYLKTVHLKFMQKHQPEKTEKILLEIQNN